MALDRRGVGERIWALWREGGGGSGEGDGARAGPGGIHNVIWHLVRAGDAVEGPRARRSRPGWCSGGAQADAGGRPSGLTAWGEGDPGMRERLAWKRRGGSCQRTAETPASRESAIWRRNRCEERCRPLHRGHSDAHPELVNARTARPITTLFTVAFSRSLPHISSPPPPRPPLPLPICPRASARPPCLPQPHITFALSLP